MRRSILSERNLVVVLFIIVIIIFSFAQQDTQSIEKMYFNSGETPVIGFDQAAPSIIIDNPTLR